MHSNLQHVVALLAAKVVGFDDVFEREVMGEQRCEIDAFGFDEAQEAEHALLAAGTERGGDCFFGEAVAETGDIDGDGP